MATPPSAAHRKRSFPQTINDDIDNNCFPAIVNSNSSGNDNDNSAPKRRCKSTIPRPRPSQTTGTLTDSARTPNNAKKHSTNDDTHKAQRHTGLLRAVLSQNTRKTSKQSPPRLPEFGFLESDIKFADILGVGQHAIVFEITAGNKTFALKVYKYNADSISDTSYPKANAFFDSESSAYERFSHFHTETRPPIPKCYGFIQLTKPPQKQDHKPRHLFRSALYRQAVYLDFITPRIEDDASIEAVAKDRRWKEYFRNKDGKCILYGLVLEKVTGRSLDPTDASNQLLAQAGTEALRRIHMAGVLHGDLSNFENNAIVATVPNTPKEERFVWIDFSMAKSRSDMRGSLFNKAASAEIDGWTRAFKPIN